MKTVDIPHQVLFLLYLQNVVIVVSKSCFQSIPTQTIVESCPEDSTEWIKASDKKQCNRISHNCSEIDDFQYHCLPNRLLNKLVEVCAPTKVIVGQHCPYYDLQRAIIEPNFNQPCSSHSDPCAIVYSSSVTYKYQQCYKEIKGKKATLASYESKVKLDVSDSNPALLIGIFVIGAILIIIVILFAIRIHYLRPFTGNQNDQNINLHRIDEETALHVHNGRETTEVEN